MIAAFFDLDGTLSTVHVWHALAQHNREQRVNRLALWRYLAMHYPQFLLYRLHLISRDEAYTSWARDMGWLIGGLSMDQGQAAFDWVADRQVVPAMRSDVVALLRRHQDQGHRVVLVSGTFQPLLETVGGRLGVTECVGTQLEVRDGRYTGGAREPVCLGAGKVKRLRQFLAGPGDNIDLEQSFAYGDGSWDIPVLETVGRPVAVYADPGLLEEARRRGWQVFPEGYQAAKPE